MSRKEERQEDRNEKKRKERRKGGIKQKKIRENKKAGNGTKKQAVWPIRQHTQGSKNGSKVEKTEGR